LAIRFLLRDSFEIKNSDDTCWFLYARYPEGRNVSNTIAYPEISSAIRLGDLKIYLEKTPHETSRRRKNSDAAGTAPETLIKRV